MAIALNKDKLKLEMKLTEIWKKNPHNETHKVKFTKWKEDLIILSRKLTNKI